MDLIHNALLNEWDGWDVGEAILKDKAAAKKQATDAAKKKQDDNHVSSGRQRRDQGQAAREAGVVGLDGDGAGAGAGAVAAAAPAAAPAPAPAAGPAPGSARGAGGRGGRGVRGTARDMDGQSGVTEGGGKDSDIMSKLLGAVMDGTEANKTMAGAVVEQGLAMKPILLGVAKEMKLKNKRAALDYDRELKLQLLPMT